MSNNKIIVKTNIDHNINDTEYKREIALTASLIKYQGEEYLNKLKALNSEYEIINHTILEQATYGQKLAEKT